MACRLRSTLLVQPTPTMKPETTTPEEFESTYALILRSDEKERNVSETVIYLLLILSTVFSIWEVAQQPFQVPTNLIIRSAPVAQAADGQRPRQDV